MRWNFWRRSRFLLLALVICLSLSGCSRSLVFSTSSDASESSASEETADSDAQSALSSDSQTADSNAVSDTTSETESEPEEPVYPSLLSDEPITEYAAVVVVGDAAYEYYSYSETKAQKYTNLVNTAAEQLSGICKVYDMVVPTSVGITFPDNYAQQGVSKSSDMQQSLTAIYEQLSGSVTPIRLYDTLMSHREEYIYFRTDHHWTALGAYYAYAQFCQEKGIAPHALSEYTARDFEGFLGSFYKDTDESTALGGNPDTITAYYPVGQNITLNFTDLKGNSYDWPIISNVEKTAASSKYSTFAGGDNPYTIIQNPDAEEGSSCIVVKESFGNALIPFLADHYQTIYELDYRYWTGDLVSFAKEQQVKDLLFVNNVSMIRSDYLIGKLSQIIS